MSRDRRSGLTIGGGLAWACLLFAIPMLALTGLLVAGSAGDLLHARKEERGVAYLAQIWPAMGDVDRDLGPGEPAADLEFGTADAAADFIRSGAVDTRFKAGSQLIAEVADASGLSLDGQLGGEHLTEAVAVRLPVLLNAGTELSEAAQIRDADQATRLAVALDRLQVAADQAQAALDAAMRYDPSGVAHSVLYPHVAGLGAAARDLAARGQAVAGGGDPNAVTGARVGLQHQVDGAWRATEDELYRLIDARILALSERLAAELVLVLALLIAAAAIAVRIARGLTGRVGDLAEAGEQLAADRVGPVVPHLDAPGVIGRLAQALNGVRETLIARNSQRFEADDRHRLIEAQLDAAQETIKAAQAERRAAIDSLGATIRRLGEGDLTAVATAPLAEDFEGLRGELNEAATVLRETLDGVAGEAGNLRRELEGLAQSGDDLARRESEQRSGLDGAARTLGALSEAAQQALSEARQVSQAAGAAKGEAEQGDAIVRQAAQAMEQIDKLAREITQIIGVMDEIAFQTNLLALNAGVEAARSGDAGRGFAVVAQEVRALAQRSATAAKDIRGLINTSSAQVGAGVELVGQTSQALARILAQVARIDSGMRDLAGQAETQAGGLSQVGDLVGRIDAAANRGAAALDQSAAATRALRAQAEELAAWMAGLTLKPPEPASRRPVRPPPEPVSPPRPAPHSAPVIQLSQARQAPGGLRPFPELRPGRRFEGGED